MKVKYIRLFKSCNGKFLLGAHGPDAQSGIAVEAHALGGAVPGFLVHYPGHDGLPASSEFIPSSNVERAQLEAEPETPAAKKPTR